MNYNKPDQILGVSMNTQSGGYSGSKEYRKLGKKDSEIVRALVNGNLSIEEAGPLGLILDIAGDDPGTQRAVLQNIAITKGLNGRTERLAVMVDTGTVALPWENVSNINGSVKKEYQHYDYAQKNGGSHNGGQPGTQVIYDDGE